MIMAVHENFRTEISFLTEKPERMLVNELCYLQVSTVVRPVEEKLCFEKKVSTKAFNLIYGIVGVDS